MPAVACTICVIRNVGKCMHRVANKMASSKLESNINNICLCPSQCKVTQGGRGEEGRRGGGGGRRGGETYAFYLPVITTL